MCTAWPFPDLELVEDRNPPRRELWFSKRLAKILCASARADMSAATRVGFFAAAK
jgi:hypothetical protein